jgi:hypothetical protein
MPVIYSSAISPGLNTIPVAGVRPDMETHGCDTTGGSDSLTPPPERNTVSTPAVKTCGTTVGAEGETEKPPATPAQTFQLGMKVQQDLAILM